MNLHLAPECRILSIPDGTTVHELQGWLDNSGLRLKSKDGKLWLVPENSHPRCRVGDLLATIQTHPNLHEKHTYSTVNGYVSEGQDSRYLYKMVVTEKP